MTYDQMYRKWVDHYAQYPNWPNPVTFAEFNEVVKCEINCLMDEYYDPCNLPHNDDRYISDIFTADEMEFIANYYIDHPEECDPD